jgi:hypothetical protein
MVESTGERPTAKTLPQIIAEAKRIEERTRDSMKSHHCAAEGWDKRGVQLGVPTAIISGITSLAVFAQASKDLWWMGVIAALLSVTVTILTTLTSVFKPEERKNAHLTAANAYDRLNDEARIFWTIDCWAENATEETLTARIKELSARKDKLNSDSPQPPPWAWKMARERLAAGEGDYAVDQPSPTAVPAPAPEPPPPAIQPPEDQPPVLGRRRSAFDEIMARKERAKTHHPDGRPKGWWERKP